MMKIFEVFGYPPIGQKGSAIAVPQHFSHHDKYVPADDHVFNHTHLTDIRKIFFDPPQWAFYEENFLRST